MPTLSSQIAGYTSLACWLCVFAPQLYENYRRKSTAGLSVGFVAMWLIGDVFSVAGAIMNQLLWTVICVGFYYAAVEIALLYQVYLYHPSSSSPPKSTPSAPTSPKLPATEQTPLISPSDARATAQKNVQLLAIAGVVCLNLFGRSAAMGGVGGGYDVAANVRVFGDGSGSEVDEHTLLTPAMKVVADSMGYASALLYMGARIPQIFLNFKNHSCEGLSILMFALSVCGNLTFAASIFLESTETWWIVLNLPWLLGSLGTMFLDFVVLFQFHHYHDKNWEERIPAYEELTV
ncbi:uncharacterized protein EV422DRAFT_163282 [Fimicolochytrium jonesii]|uniref:uncharacterized protein n=1 Tax=Fimicolochytrium jonesii TaxID=1396493 RepID=UPI0022FF0B26|nr:uncharacterized protein EV422DRAFT_163282 [Fimicolochytrium jonesii]KAI8818741.1 hypothetical protein EV422DRAFT_163282 [Fimicolochytrium jonesii]